MEDEASASWAVLMEVMLRTPFFYSLLSLGPERTLHLGVHLLVVLLSVSLIPWILFYGLWELIYFCRNSRKLLVWTIGPATNSKLSVRGEAGESPKLHLAVQ
jgi:hypothetical protein